MFHSPEFWAPESYRAKVKTPLEFVVSAVRASGAEVSDALPLARQLQNHGHAALRDAAAHRLFHEGRCLGKFVRAAGPNELRAGSDRRKVKRRAGGLRSHARHGRVSRRLASRPSRRSRAVCWLATCPGKPTTRLPRRCRAETSRSPVTTRRSRQAQVRSQACCWDRQNFREGRRKSSRWPLVVGRCPEARARS